MRSGTITNAMRGALHQVIWSYSKWLLILGLAAYTLSGIYKIPGDAIGVLIRFGKVVEPRVSPGLHYKLPWPVDRVETLQIKQVKTITIKDFGSDFMKAEGGVSYSFYKETNLQPYCITGDNNIVAITLVLKYTLDNPIDYLYGMKRPESFMKRCTASLIVNHLAKLQIDEVLTIGKKQLEFDLQRMLIEQLDQYKTGIRLSFLEIKEIAPPTQVQQYFDKVINAGMEKQKMLNEAQGYFNRIVPNSRSEANRMLQDARAYKREKVLAAEGEADNFLSRYHAYAENPAAHREKLYLEFIKNLYPKLGKVRIVENQSTSNMSILPIPTLE